MEQKKSLDLKNIDWVSTIFLSLTPPLALVLGVGYLYYHGMSWGIVFLTVFFYYACGMSITAGYHRYFSHRTYEASLPVKIFFLLFGAGSFQHSVLNWCTGHRIHHRYVDTDRDPYNAKRGFWYSHLLWMFEDKDPLKTPLGQQMSRDLRKDPWVVFQHKHYYLIAVFMCFILPMLVGGLMGRPFGGLIFAGLVRMVFVHHFTYFINSLCHMIGTQNYGQENTARDSMLVSLLTYGEGYHNFHHHFQNDYRNGIRWYDFDPTKWLIRLLSWLGLARKLKIEPEANIILAKVTWDRKKLASKLSQQLRPFQEKVDRLKENIDSCGERYQQLQQEYREMKQRLREKRDLNYLILKRDLKLARNELRIRYSHWRKIVGQLEAVTI
jgi:stearoyl-CoA desaturase (Delta-9 desaturase)